MAIDDRNGITACAPHHGASAPNTASANDRSDELRNGANNFTLMLAKIREIGDVTVGANGATDGRDYKAMTCAIESTVIANLMGSDKATRQGFLRAFADYLSIIEDGFYPEPGWNGDAALTSTARAFDAAGVICQRPNVRP